jgi:hypothetical protein
MYIDETYFFWFLVVTDVLVFSLFMRLLWIDCKRKKGGL